ncbi:MAG: peptidoglycan DD-metalloendopeptidase family protein, partial [Robiginitalea sp.]
RQFCQHMQAHPILDPGIPLSAYRKVDLSVTNSRLGDALSGVSRCQAFLAAFLREENGQVAWGGYLEKRELYRDFKQFNPAGGQAREYHLGVDFWAGAGTGVYAPWDGTVHSWAHRTSPGDYGPVILFEHRLDNVTVYSLFGHLSIASLQGLYEGKPIRRGDLIGHLGSSGENGGYAPHLHFQLMYHLQDFRGDYPGVCTLSDLLFFSENCPDPIQMLRYF